MRVKPGLSYSSTRVSLLCPGGAAEQEGEILPQPLQGLLPTSPLSFWDLATACFLHHKHSTGFAESLGGCSGSGDLGTVHPRVLLGPSGE